MDRGYHFVYQKDRGPPLNSDLRPTMDLCKIWETKSHCQDRMLYTLCSFQTLPGRPKSLDSRPLPLQWQVESQRMDIILQQQLEFKCATHQNCTKIYQRLCNAFHLRQSDPRSLIKFFICSLDPFLATSNNSFFFCLRPTAKLSAEGLESTF
jgi:hypothetical protein